jgi:hypothetical protein
MGTSPLVVTSSRFRPLLPIPGELVTSVKVFRLSVCMHSEAPGKRSCKSILAESAYLHGLGEGASVRTSPYVAFPRGGVSDRKLVDLKEADVQSWIRWPYQSLHRGFVGLHFYRMRTNY